MAAKKIKKVTKKELRDLKIRRLAHGSSLLHDGELELDDNAKISEGDDNGAYIQTWMWVSFEDTPFDRGEDTGPKDWSPIKKPKPTDMQIWKLANESNLLRDGELELDLNAKTSQSDSPNWNGAYIQTWMWVPFEDTELDKEA